MRFAPSTDRKSSSDVTARRLYAITADYRGGFPAQLKSLLELGRSQFQLDVAILSRVQGAELEVVDVVRPDDLALSAGKRFALAATCCSLTLEANGPYGFEHAKKSGSLTDLGYGSFAPESYLGIPIYLGGSAAGTLSFSSAHPRDPLFDYADVDSLRMMATWLETELYRRQLESDLVEAQRRLEYLARTDPLTELSNLRGIEDTLASLRERCRRDEAPLSCVLIDIDGFTMVNDAFGHATGEAVIREVAATVRTCLRPTDAAGRVGDDEFLALLPGMGVEAAVAVAERIRREVRSMRIESDAGKVVTPTVSIGVAPAPAAKGSVKDLVRSAESLLRRGRRPGGDMVVAGDLPNPPVVLPGGGRYGILSPSEQRWPAAE
jgi:diguanylate cyclase (GGDEF)-like protein